MFINYFKLDKFKGAYNQYDKNLATEIGKFFDEQEVFDLINAKRVANGLPTLKIDDELQNVARIKAHLRREQRVVVSEAPETIEIGEISINTASYEVFKNSQNIPFSTREFQLLEYLMVNAGKVLTREQIFSDVWDTEFGDIGTVAVNIKSIRDKIDPDNRYIKTVWGVGYKFVKVYK